MKFNSDHTYLIMSMTFALGITVIFERHAGFNGQGLQLGNNVGEAVTIGYRRSLVTGDMSLCYMLRSHILRASFSPYISGIL